MLQVSENELKNRLLFDNPWWEKGGSINPEVDSWPRRAYFDSFVKLVSDVEVRRAVVLMGPRRVGKTVLCQHAIKRLLDDGIPNEKVFYVSVDNPVYAGVALEKLVRLFQGIHGHKAREAGLFVFFDEIQYLKDWEVHLKSLVDSYPGIKFVASGSAAAALRMKSRESGAGRFTDFLLPPLTFAEFLQFREVESELVEELEDERFRIRDMVRLNEEFVAYMNFGGFPEPVFSPAVRENVQTFVGNDIIDKVLLRDLPSLYGISDSRELNQLFSLLAYNTGQEVSLDGLSKSSGVAKNTIRKYLDYLEAAFLIHRVYRVDQSAHRFKRAVTFKVYLTNPSLRAALFGEVSTEDAVVGHLAETAAFAHSLQMGFMRVVHYARWKGGEVDWVMVNPTNSKPIWVAEIKWSDRPFTHPESLRHLLLFSRKNGIDSLQVWSRTARGPINFEGLTFHFVPVAEVCYWLSRTLMTLFRSHGGFDPRTLQPYLSRKLE